LETEYGLVRAEGMKASSSHRLEAGDLGAAEYGKAPTKRTISNIVTAVTGQFAFSSLAELNAVLRLYRVTAERGPEGSEMHRRGGLVYSLLDQSGERIGVPIKASSLPGKPTLSRLEEKFEGNKVRRKPSKEPLASAIRKVLNGKPDSQEAFIRELAKERVSVIFRENGQGFTYGVTFIDHRHKTVFNGSTLGKDFSAKALTSQFSPSATSPQADGQQNSPLVPSGNISERAARDTSGHAPGQGSYLLEQLLSESDIWQGPLLPRKKGKKKKRRFRL